MSLNEIEIHCLKDKKQTETLTLDNVKTSGRITCLIIFNKHFESNENN